MMLVFRAYTGGGFIQNDERRNAEPEFRANDKDSVRFADTLITAGSDFSKGKKWDKGKAFLKTAADFLSQKEAGIRSNRPNARSFCPF